MDRAAFDKKAPQCGAFLLWLCCAFGLAFLPSPSAADSCSVPKDAELAAVRQVIDGDTLQLRDGRHVRLIGLDTPEIGHDGKRDMPGGQAAKAALRRLVREGGDRVYLQLGRESRDRYHRWLAHLYTPDGKSLTQALLREGLGRQIAFPPNLSNFECYRDAEASARANKRGLWQTAVQEAASLHGDESG
ncbi:MAG: thermonuclease family protein, partial [Candidatus Thiodiazotropha sp.]